ncbi:MAG: TonB-dependent receptor [Bacteroidetes bacterium]|nr:MAG: TonB-dependent receptor [Bacteroidota bacterium]
MVRNYFLFRLLFIGAFLSTLISGLYAQETNSRASGRVISDSNETQVNVTVTIIHEPTQNKYVNLTNKDGYFYFFNLKPGGPYSITFSSVGYETLKKNDLFIHLTGEYFFINNSEIADFTLKKKNIALDEVIINARSDNRNKSGVETIITGTVLKSMPSIGRSFQDYIRLVPQAKVNGEGVMSLAGQNNRFNAFFIDGANNTDIKGTSVNGMNGGQTGAPPVSIESIEEINVLLSPYNVQYGNFTGGSINAITRSGSNETKSSAWYYFRNENLAGRSPQPVEKPNEPGNYYRPRLSTFFNQVFGAWNSGALIKNKLFYFALVERQSESRPQPFNMADYRGNSNQQQLELLSGFIHDTYQYDPGSFLETKDELDATRLNLKLDWNASLKDKFMLSYRYSYASRRTAPRPSGANAISFDNNGIILPSCTHSSSLEWLRFLKPGMNNRLLLTFTNVAEVRKWIGEPFPSVTILDGNGTLSFGSEANTDSNDFKASDLSLFDVFTYIKKKSVYSIGTDINYSAYNLQLLSFFFGAYQFRSLSDFVNIIAPSRLQRAFYQDSRISEKFHTLRSSFFANDEIRLRKNLKLNFGLRLDVNSIVSKPAIDQFFNDTAINIISRYYDLEGARSGKPMDAQWGLSPRFSLHYNLLNQKINLTGGAGIFIGHPINSWTFDVFNSSTGNIDIVPSQFYPDPYNQPTPESLNMDPSNLKGALNLMAKHYKYPSVFRSSFTAEKKLQNNWTISIEGIFTKNIHETVFRNVNILPPTLTSALPDSRNIYSLNSAPTKIPLKSNGINPFSQVMLLANNHGKKGSSYSLSFIIHKQANSFSFNSSYTYGRSNLLFEITGPQTLVLSQWRNMETVNGRNFAPLSTSDNDLRHRITTWISKKINYSKNRTATTISLFYNGQSGSPYSYVYTNSMINDNGKRNENFDLIYIPTTNDLINMSFAPITGSVSYTPQQQKDALNVFIEGDKYLREHRGEFSQRNGARLPFTHIIDLRLQQDFTLKIKDKKVGLTITYDVFNFTNMLNKNWGHTWFLTNDSYPLITFESFISTTTLTPQYQFRPFNGKPWTLQTSTIPGNSARWISQLGIKINLN